MEQLQVNIGTLSFAALRARTERGERATDGAFVQSWDVGPARVPRFGKVFWRPFGRALSA